MEGCSVDDCAPQVQAHGSGLCFRPTWRESRLCSSAGYAQAGRLSQRSGCLLVFCLLPLAVISCFLGVPVASAVPAPPRRGAALFPADAVRKAATRGRRGLGRAPPSLCLLIFLTQYPHWDIPSIRCLPVIVTHAWFMFSSGGGAISRHLLDSQLSVIHKQYLLYTLIGYLDTQRMSFKGLTKCTLLCSLNFLPAP